MTQEMCDNIYQEIKKITRILSYLAVQNKTQREQISILSDIGFQPKEIAELLGTTSNTVRVSLVDIRKKAKKSAISKKAAVKGTTQNDK